MTSFIQKNLTVKIVIALAAIMVVAFALLCVSIITKQNGLLGEMSSTVDTKLESGSDEAKSRFQQLESEVGAELNKMSSTVGTSLSKTTKDALYEEEKNIQVSMEKLLESNAKGAGLLLAQIILDPLMAKEYDKLSKYSQALAQSPEIVYVLFQDEKANNLPSYLNLVDDLVLSYIDSGGDDEDATEKVLRASKNDTSVLIYEQVVEYYNLPIGKIIICMNKSAVTSEINALAGRFNDLKQANETKIQSILSSESERVVQKIRDNLQQVAGDHEKSQAETVDILKKSTAAVNSGTTRVIIMIGLACVLGIILLIYMLLRFIVLQPMQRITEGLRDAAEGEGDLTRRLNSTRKDEIGVLAGWFDSFVEKLHNIIVEINGNSETVTSSALEALSASEDMHSEATNLSEKTGSVAAASEEMDRSMSSVAAASEQASTNISLVVETAAEMKNALERVSDSCDEAQNVSNSATDQVKTATEKVTLLGDAANEISKVTEVITEIADQTNLLALNATIEAARAGDAGKGFAVVAGEIKTLANQTQDATKEIKNKIDSIQGSTNETIAEVEAIAAVIENVNKIITNISQAMVTQAESASEVALNIEQASLGISEVNENVAQTSTVSSQIAGAIGEVNEIAASMSQNSVNMRNNSESLSELANQLRTMISSFKIASTQVKGGSNKKGGGREVADVFPWTPKLMLGVPKIDEQHKELVRLINKLHRAMKSGVGAGAAAEILTELSDYTVYHFGFEEKAFEEFGYPETDEHKKYHKHFVDKVVSFQKDFEGNRAGLSMDLMLFLTNWLKEHIMKQDKAYVPYIGDKV